MPEKCPTNKAWYAKHKECVSKTAIFDGCLISIKSIRFLSISGRKGILSEDLSNFRQVVLNIRRFNSWFSILLVSIVTSQ